MGLTDAPALTEIVLVMIAPREDFNVMTYFVTWLAAFVAVGTFNATITFVLFTPIATAVAMAPEGMRAMETGVPIALTNGAGGAVVEGACVGGVVVVGVSGAAVIVNECTTPVAAAYVELPS